MSSLTEELSHFTGTEGYHKWSMLFRNMVLTDGTLHLAETAGAYWLMDAIASYLPKYKKDGFAVVVLGRDTKHHGDGFTLRIVDDIPSNTVYAKQKIEFSDFPLDEIKLYVAQADENLWVIMLPSEY